MAQLKLSKRDRLGTRAARRLRQQGLVPAIIYGHGEENTPVGLPRHDIELAVRHGERLLKAELDGREQNFLIKDVQYDYLGQGILHVDLTRVSLDERVEVTVPVVLRGRPVGVDAEGGVLTQLVNEVACDCLVTEIPEELSIVVGELHVGESVRVSDLQLPARVRVLAEPETLVATVTVVAEEEVVPAAEEAAAAQPEVIGEKPEEPAADEEKEKPRESR
ncbi:MAG: hypothetical protein AMJ81_10825 [Phycisphaerae bacterium SM23_33]|jgi:large subunit ribosomal protein L25|nr:MAG: hypothetical protein AMJ81_10825 [Phycisphaerae bacterium SM23_33]